MRCGPHWVGWMVGALLMALSGRAAAEGKPLHLALVVADLERQAAVHEAVMVALAKAGFDPSDEDAVEPDITSEDVTRLSKQHKGEAVLLMKVEGDASAYHLTAFAVSGKLHHTEEADAQGKGLASAAALAARLSALAVSPNLTPAVRQSSSTPTKALADESSSELLGGPIGRLGLEVGLSGLGVLVIGYVPALILAGQYGKTVPNASRAGVAPLVGPFNARSQLSDEILNDGASPGLIADGMLQVIGTAGFLTGVGMITYAKIQQYREQQAEAPTDGAPSAKPASKPADAPAAKPASKPDSDEPVSIAPIFAPGYGGIQVAFAW